MLVFCLLNNRHVEISLDLKKHDNMSFMSIFTWFASAMKRMVVSPSFFFNIPFLTFSASEKKWMSWLCEEVGHIFSTCGPPSSMNWLEFPGDFAVDAHLRVTCSNLFNIVEHVHEADPACILLAVLRSNKFDRSSHLRETQWHFVSTRREQQAVTLYQDTIPSLRKRGHGPCGCWSLLCSLVRRVLNLLQAIHGLANLKTSFNRFVLSVLA